MSWICFHCHMLSQYLVPRVFSSAWDFQGLSAFTWDFNCLAELLPGLVFFSPHGLYFAFSKSRSLWRPWAPSAGQGRAGLWSLSRQPGMDLLPGRLAAVVLSFSASSLPGCLPLSLTWFLPSFFSFLMSFVRSISASPFQEAPGKYLCKRNLNPCFLQFGVTHVHLSVVHWCQMSLKS